MSKTYGNNKKNQNKTVSKKTDDIANNADDPNL